MNKFLTFDEFKDSLIHKDTVRISREDFEYVSEVRIDGVDKNIKDLKKLIDMKFVIF